MSNYYLAPTPFGKDAGDASAQLGWSREAIQQARSYLRLQPAYPYIQEGLDLINGETQKQKVATLSDARTELVVRNIKELVASISNVRIIPAFKTEIDQYKAQQSTLNKTYMVWQAITFSDRVMRKGWQFAAGGGTGYLGIRWERDYWYRGKGEIVLDSYGPLDILPVGLPKSHELQKAYCVGIRVETPWHEVIRRYPAYRDLIKPSRENTKGMGGSVIAAAVKYTSAALRRFGPGATQENEAAPWAMVDVYHLYIDDDSINNTGQQIVMGDPDTSWEYLVPYLGQEIVTRRDAQGFPVEVRNATAEDCRLYPNRRKIVCTDSVVLNPDPTRQVNEYHHGKIPIVQLRADDWAWSFLGFPLTRAGSSLEKSNNEILRGAVDMVNNRLSPSRMYDKNTMSQAMAQTINTRIPNQVIGMDLSLTGEQMKPLLPAEYLNLPSNVLEILELNEKRINHQMGVGEAMALAQARQLPSGDSFERIMDALGALIKDQSRNMEASVRDLGEMWKSNVFQFYRAPRFMEILGPDGVVEETFQVDIGDMIPGPDPGTDAPYFDRARKHAARFAFSVAPYSLHELNSVTRKLFHLQLMRSGFPIDWWTLAEVFDIQNFGMAPMIDDPDKPGEKREALTVFEKWMAQMEIQARMQAAMQPAPAGAPPGVGGGPVAVPGKKPEGRPPTAQNPPAMEQKSDGRPIIRESKR